MVRATTPRAAAATETPLRPAALGLLDSAGAEPAGAADPAGDPEAVEAAEGFASGYAVPRGLISNGSEVA